MCTEYFCSENMCNTSSAYHVQHVVLRATCYEGTAQLLSLTKLKLHLFELYLIGLTIKAVKDELSLLLHTADICFSFYRSTICSIGF